MAASLNELRDEHRALLPEIAALRSTADAVGRTPLADLAASVDSRLRFLVHHLRPHALAEDEVLYPVVARLIGGRGATATMERDHVEVVRLTDELADLRRRLTDEPMTDELANELRRVLYGLFAVVSLHFAKEEQVYVPLLEQRLSSSEADQMFEEMHTVHHRLAHGDRSI